MKHKQILTIFLISLFLVQSQVNPADSSLKPIITTNMPQELKVGLQDVNLTWYIIDDNLKSYSLFINTSIWKQNEKLDSNLIQVIFSAAEGYYNVSLIVQDYSGYNVSTYQLIAVSTAYNTSSATNTSTNSTNTNGSAAATSPAWSSIMALISLSIIIQIKRKYSRRR